MIDRSIDPSIPGPSRLEQVKTEEVPPLLCEKIAKSIGRLMRPLEANVDGPDVNGMLVVTFSNILQGPSTLRMHINEWFTKWNDYSANAVDDPPPAEHIVAMKYIPFILKNNSRAEPLSQSDELAPLSRTSLLSTATACPEQCSISPSSTSPEQVAKTNDSWSETHDRDLVVSCEEQSSSYKSEDVSPTPKQPYSPTPSNINVIENVAGVSRCESKLNGNCESLKDSEGRSSNLTSSPEIPESTDSVSMHPNGTQEKADIACSARQLISLDCPAEMKDISCEAKTCSEGETPWNSIPTQDEEQTAQSTNSFRDSKCSSTESLLSHVQSSHGVPTTAPSTDSRPNDVITDVVMHVADAPAVLSLGVSDKYTSDAKFIEARVPPLRIRKPTDGSDFRVIPPQMVAEEQGQSTRDSEHIGSPDGRALPNARKRKRKRTEYSSFFVAPSTSTPPQSNVAAQEDTNLPEKAEGSVFASVRCSQRGSLRSGSREQSVLPRSTDDRRSMEKNAYSKEIKKRRFAESFKMPTDSYADLFCSYTPFSREQLSLSICEEGDTRPDDIRFVFESWRTMYLELRIFRPGAREFPIYIRYPNDIVFEDNYARHILSNQYVSIQDKPEKPDDRWNWKLLREGDIVWSRWTKNEYWPASISHFTPSEPPLVHVQWINDTTTNALAYEQVHSFDLAFHLRFNPKKCEPRYVKAICKAILIKGYIGYWEEFLTRTMFRFMTSDRDMLPLLVHLPPSLIRVLKGELGADHNPLKKEAEKLSLSRMEIAPKRKGKKSVATPKKQRDMIMKTNVAAEQQLEAVQVQHFLPIVGKPPQPRDRFAAPALQLINAFHFNMEGSSLPGPLFRNEPNHLLLSSDQSALQLSPNLPAENYLSKEECDEIFASASTTNAHPEVQETCCVSEFDSILNKFGSTTIGNDEFVSCAETHRPAGVPRNHFTTRRYMTSTHLRKKMNTCKVSKTQVKVKSSKFAPSSNR